MRPKKGERTPHADLTFVGYRIVTGYADGGAPRRKSQAFRRLVWGNPHAKSYLSSVRATLPTHPGDWPDPAEASRFEADLNHQIGVAVGLL